MSLHAELKALRRSAALTPADHVQALRVRGPDAYVALDRVLPRDNTLRDGQLLQTLLLCDDASIFADAWLGRDGDAYLLFCDGPSPSELRRYLADRGLPDADVALEDLNATHVQYSLDGPYAWEVVGELFGPDTVGLPYLTLFHTHAGLCMRLGRTGEFGYHLLVRREAQAAFEATVDALAGGLDLARGSLDALSHCALENWFFDIRAEGRLGLSPLELQLQWRLTPGKAFPGAEALQRRRRRLAQRVTTALGPAPMPPDARVRLEGQCVGRVLRSARSPELGSAVALLLLDLPVAHPGVAALRVETPDGEVPARTVSPPVIHNLSLLVSPQEHGYRAGRRVEAPPWPEEGEP
jgi:glycine cleavage system aminomethyltransferase T